MSEVALVAMARRELLLRAHRFRLRREDLEDAYAQATLELVGQAQAGVRFQSRTHLAHVLEQRFVSRIRDRRRALSGRSPMQSALETSVSLSAGEQPGMDLADSRADPERLLLAREELARIVSAARSLTRDQRLLLASQLALQPGAEFRRIHAWSPEKYRKVGQRARARLRLLLEQQERPVP